MLGHPRRACRCAPSAVTRYRNRISDPLLERIDLVIEIPVEPKKVRQLWEKSLCDVESTAEVQARVMAARNFTRRQHRPQIPNARLSGTELRHAVRLSPQADRLLADAASRWSLSARAVHRTLRVARTIADLGAKQEIAAEAIAEALSMRHETLR